MASSKDYWNEYLEGCRSSIFPTLTCKGFQDGSRSSVAIPTEDGLSEVAGFCAAQEVPPLSLLQLTWAIVLRCYLASDGVVFGYRTKSTDTEDDFVCRIDFNSELSVASILQQTRGVHEHHEAAGSPDTAAFRTLYNTLLVLRFVHAEFPSNIEDDPQVGMSQTKFGIDC